MANFTPGPWIATNFSTRNGVDSTAESANIAVVGYSWNGHEEEIQANRNLIAAAPEMYEALKKAKDGLEAAGMGANFIDAVLAKAEGKSK